MYCTSIAIKGYLSCEAEQFRRRHMHAYKQTYEKKQINKQDHHSRSEMQSAPSTNWIYKWGFFRNGKCLWQLWKPKRTDVTVDIEKRQKAKRKAIVLWNSNYRLCIYLYMEDLPSEKVPKSVVFGKDNEFYMKKQTKQQIKQNINMVVGPGMTHQRQPFSSLRASSHYLYYYYYYQYVFTKIEVFF